MGVFEFLGSSMESKDLVHIIYRIYPKFFELNYFPSKQTINVFPKSISRIIDFFLPLLNKNQRDSIRRLLDLINPSSFVIPVLSSPVTF